MMCIAGNLDTRQYDPFAWTMGRARFADSILVPPIETQSCSCKNPLQTRCELGGMWQVGRCFGRTH